MEFRQLEYFAHIVEQGSFTAAARKCSLAQPSLSAQIQKLEEELGEPLLLRRARGIALTTSGQAVYEQAKVLLAGRNRLLASFQNREEARRGEVTLGLIPTIAPYLLGHLLGAFREEFPNIRVQVREAQTAQLVEWVVNEEVDFAVISDLAQNVLKRRALHLRALFREPLLLAVPGSHPLANRRQATLKLGEVPKDELLLLGEGHCFRDQALALCQLEDAPQQPIRCEQLVTLMSLVSSGLGVAFVPQMFREHQPTPGVSYLRLKDPVPHRAINILKRRGKKLKPSADCLHKALGRWEERSF
ncbi:LysR family transcriptional regulator [Roseibacillus ishigakijimensis]|uniref:LysR family transcriptional regulator n=1 Tax=Roseibacillus ishigakijimensis TaxID=454146 RepID=A0A934RQI5_9BACT|nr:LysR family transcriptional regulator [Roseibacillus ishigakijimensis]MBK1835120.1 LysR family transcriptional regulator [Roseibacillus ishigakijimensis]